MRKVPTFIYVSFLLDLSGCQSWPTLVNKVDFPDLLGHGRMIYNHAMRHAYMGVQILNKALCGVVG
jgi:hypothetical protein